MSVRGRLASYALVLLAAFGAGVGLGELLPGGDQPVGPQHDEHDDHGTGSP